jgi:hypothetical protein
VITNEDRESVHTGSGEGGRHVRMELRLQNEDRDDVHSEDGEERHHVGLWLQLQNEGGMTHSLEVERVTH